MEDKIEVGEYVRTTDGKIGIFDRYSSRKDDSLYKSSFDCFIKIKNRKTCLQCSREYIKNHSKNIKGILEKGDYVDGKKVNRIEKNYIVVNEIWTGRELICYEDIKSIVTKEQFESVKYEVKEQEEIITSFDKVSDFKE